MDKSNGRQQPLFFLPENYWFREKKSKFGTLTHLRRAKLDFGGQVVVKYLK